MSELTTAEQEAVNRITDRAGTTDADFSILKAAAELLVDAETRNAKLLEEFGDRIRSSIRNIRICHD